MYTGKLVFSQLMEHLPWDTFHRYVKRYNGNHKVKSFFCAEQYRCMAFAQLAYRDSLRDVETCLRAQAKKLYHMGISSGISRSTLAVANRNRNWQIYADFAHSTLSVKPACSIVTMTTGLISPTLSTHWIPRP